MKYSDDIAGLRSFLFESFDSAWERYVEIFIETKRECCEQNVHDLRVAIRRLRTVLSVVIIVNRSASSLVLRDTLRVLFRKLSKLRDTQALIVHITKLINKYPELLGFLEFLQKREKRLRKQTQNFLRKIDMGEMQTSRLCVSFGIKYSDISAENFNVLINKLDALYKDFIGKNQAASSEDVQSVHNVRIALKKYRYLSEILLPIFNRKKKDLRYLSDLQDSLGTVQDFALLTNVFGKYIEKHPQDKERYENFNNYLKMKIKSNIFISMENITELPEKPMIFYTIEELEAYQ